MAKKSKGRGRHSPAGYAWLMEQARKTTPVYFKNIKRKSDVSRLRKAGLTESDLAALGVGKLTRKKR